MPAGQFHHFGVPTKTKHGNATYLAGGKLFITDPESHPYRVEFLRFESDSPMPDVLKNRPHAAFIVPDLEQALKGQNVVIPPFDATPTFRVAFVLDGDALIELMQVRSGS